MIKKRFLFSDALFFIVIFILRFNMSITGKIDCYINRETMQKRFLKLNDEKGFISYKRIGLNLFELEAKSNSLFFGSSSFIGAYSYVGSNGYIKNSFIGRYCSIGHRVTIGAGVHKINSISTHPAIGGGRALLTILHNDIWVGDGVVIMPGVSIGNGAVVGSNAVVTKDVLPYSIVAGVPAKHLRFRFDEATIDKLIELNWWDLKHEYLTSLARFNLSEQMLSVSRNYNENFVIYDTFQYEL